MLYFCGYYDGLTKNSAFIPAKFDSMGKVMLYVKAHLDYFRERCYGFTVFTDEKVREGRHMIQKRLLSWHRDGTDCAGELINPDIGWKIYIDAQNDISEEHFTPKGD